MSQGIAGYGTYGMGVSPMGMSPMGVSPMGGIPTGPSPMGGTFIGPIYCPPLDTQAIRRAVHVAQQKATMDMVENARQAQVIREQIAAQAAYNVQHGIVPVVVDNSSSTGYSSSSLNRHSSSNSSNRIQYGDKICKQCMGSGICSSCNGTGIQNHMNTTLCGVCYNHNGKCKWCSGRGTNYGMK